MFSWMATMTYTAKKAQEEVITWFKSAARGKDVRIRFGKTLYVLHVAGRAPKGYAETEYGVSRRELKAFAERMDAKIEKDRKAGRSKRFTGDIEALVSR
jgi:hypothetical protein